MSVLYIQIRRNQITVRDLESKREVSGDAAFSNQRLLIANFFVAEKVDVGIFYRYGKFIIFSGPMLVQLSRWPGEFVVYD